jgi:hypothetical protein
MSKTPEEMAGEYATVLEAIPLMHYLPTEPCRKAFLAGYQAAAKQWISVKDRLPEVGVNVLLIVADGGFVTSGWLSPQLQVFECAYGRVYWPEQITHWMPLPEPPETKD